MSDFQYDASGNLKVVLVNGYTSTQGEVHLDLVRGDIQKLTTDVERLIGVNLVLVLAVILMHVATRLKD